MLCKLFRQIGLTFILLVAISLGSCTSKYSYETVPNDPLKARIYTLDNGLKERRMALLIVPGPQL